MNKFLNIKKRILFFIFFISTCFCVRDPFNIVKSNLKSKNRSYEKANVIKLIGVVNLDNSFAAILKKGLDQKIVSINSSIWGYKVNKITLNEVELNKDSEKIQLFLT